MEAIRAHDPGEPPKTVDFKPLDERRIDLAIIPNKPEAVFTLGGFQICTAGNLTVLSAQAKSGKSAVIGAMIASAQVASLESNFGFYPQCDFLGFCASDPGRRAVILFDTEQSRYDCFKVMQRAAKRARVSSFENSFRLYSLCDLGTNERLKYLIAEMERACKECGGIHSFFVDGVADLCADPNSVEESFALVAELVRLAVKYECPIIAVLHENPGQPGGYAKTRGHLGSQLERKAESNLKIEKGSDDSCTIFGERCRNANIPKSKGVRIIWSPIEQRHVTAPNAVEVAINDQKKCEAEVLSVFDGSSLAMKWSALKGKLGWKLNLKGSSAERWITKQCNSGALLKLPGDEGYLPRGTVNLQAPSF